MSDRFSVLSVGSRVDVWMPVDTNVLVLPGQRCIAGETVIADLTNSQSEPEGGVER